MDLAVKEMREKVEKISLEGFSVEQLLNKDFLQSIRSIDNEISPIALVFIKSVKTKETETKPVVAKSTEVSDQNKEDKIKSLPIILIVSHESDKDLKDKIVHINSSDSSFVEQIKEIIKKM